MPPKAPPPFVLNKKLILHFDIENVVVFQHPNQDLQVYTMVASYAWGRIEQKDQKSPKVWKLVHLSLSTVQPEAEQQLISYKEYVEQLHPSNGEDPQRQKEIEESKGEMYWNFTKGPGSKLKTEVEKLFRSITIPKTLSDFIHTEEEAKQEVNKDYRRVIEKLASGKYQLLPSFFKLVMSLRKLKREFALVFHAKKALNHDDIIKELNLFFNGQHPFYNGKNNTPQIKFDGSKNCKNFRITDKNTSVFYRFDKPFDEDYVTFGTLKTFDDRDIESLKQKLLEIKQETRVCKSSEIYVYSHLLLKESASLYVVDDVGAMMIDQVDYNTQQLYFTSRDIEVWSCLGEQLGSEEGVYQVTVELFELIRDVEFFIKSVELAEKKMIAEIDRMEKGQPEAPKKEEQQVLSDSEYLKRNILPLLQGALRLVDIERPEDPMMAIAIYCLKNQHRLIKTEEPKTEPPS